MLAPIFLGIAAIFLLIKLFTYGRRDKRIPPGPPTIPVLGNLHQIPRHSIFLKLTEWSKEYGGIFSLKIGPAAEDTAIVVTDRRIARELLDRQASTTSDRPPHYAASILNRDLQLSMMHYGEQFRAFRKAAHINLMESVCEKSYLPFIEAEAVQSLHDILLQPLKSRQSIRRFTNSIINGIVWGIRTTDTKAPHFNAIFEIMEGSSAILEPGALPPFDQFPILRRLPERFLSNYLTKVLSIRQKMDFLYGSQFNKCLERRERGEFKGTVMDGIVEQQKSEKRPLNLAEIERLGGTLLEGGSDTSSVTLAVVVQTLTLHPRVLTAARIEMDNVVGEDRTPKWSDFEMLPYVNMIMKETHRWRPVAPSGVPHAATQDTWVDGFLVPKGSTIFLNVWGLHMDPTFFPEPEKFIPERFAGHPRLASDYSNSGSGDARDHYDFGIGRRICPGINLAERSVWILIAKMIWAFDFEHVKDANGQPLPIKNDYLHDYIDGILRQPKEYPVELRIRSETRRETLERELDEAEREVFSRYDY